MKQILLAFIIYIFTAEYQATCDELQMENIFAVLKDITNLLKTR